MIEIRNHPTLVIPYTEPKLYVNIMKLCINAIKKLLIWNREPIHKYNICRMINLRKKQSKEN